MMWLTLWLIILAGLSHMKWQIFVSVEFTHTHTIYCIIERHLCWFSNLQLQTPVCDRLATRSGCTLLLTIFGRWNWLQHSFHSQQVDNMWGMNIQLTPKNRKRCVFFFALITCLTSGDRTGQSVSLQTLSDMRSKDRFNVNTKSRKISLFTANMRVIYSDGEEVWAIYRGENRRVFNYAEHRLIGVKEWLD